MKHIKTHRLDFTVHNSNSLLQVFWSVNSFKSQNIGLIFVTISLTLTNSCFLVVQYFLSGAVFYSQNEVIIFFAKINLTITE